MGQGSESLNWFDGEEANDPHSVFYDPIGENPFPSQQPFSIKVRKAKYQQAKAAKTGVIIECPVCCTRFEKKSYQQAFCTNKGKGNCKDKYHNHATPERQKRTQLFA